jgi:hypothetical protein
MNRDRSGLAVVSPEPPKPGCSKILDDGLQKGDYAEVLKGESIFTKKYIGKIIHVIAIDRGFATSEHGIQHDISFLRKLSDAEIAERLNAKAIIPEPGDAESFERIRKYLSYCVDTGKLLDGNAPHDIVVICRYLADSLFHKEQA